MERLGAITSAHEKRAEEATRDVEAWLKCQYMEEHLGDEFDGVITGVTNFGVFVQITELLTDGLVHVTSLQTTTISMIRIAEPGRGAHREGVSASATQCASGCTGSTWIRARSPDRNISARREDRAKQEAMSKSQYITGCGPWSNCWRPTSPSSPDLCRVPDSQSARRGDYQAARQAGIEIQAANRARLTQISGEARHQGVVAEVRRSTCWTRRAAHAGRGAPAGRRRRLLLLVLDGVQDPHNLGACMRTADAAGVDAVVVPRHGAAGLGPTVSKVAAGAAEQLPFVPVGNLARVLGWLADYGVRCSAPATRPIAACLTPI